MDTILRRDDILVSGSPRGGRPASRAGHVPRLDARWVVERQAVPLSLRAGVHSGPGDVWRVHRTTPGMFVLLNPTGEEQRGTYTGTVTLSYFDGLPLDAVKGYRVVAVDGRQELVSDQRETLTPIGIGGAYRSQQRITLPDLVIPPTTLVAIPIDLQPTTSGSSDPLGRVTFSAVLSIDGPDGSQPSPPHTIVFRPQSSER